MLTEAAAGKPRPAVVAAGASVQDGFTAAAQQMGWMERPALVAVGDVCFSGPPSPPCAFSHSRCSQMHTCGHKYWHTRAVTRPWINLSG